MTQSRKIKVRNQIAYGIGDLYGGGSFFLVSTFAMYYLITVVGLSPLMAALIPGLGKVWDAVSDPLMGYITDNTRSRFGRRRLYFLIGIIPIILSFSLIWLPVSFKSQMATFFYYFVSYLFFYTVITMVMTPYSALSAEMSVNFKERNRLTGTRMIFSLLATLIGGLLAQPIIDMFPDPGQGHLAMGIAFSILFAFPWIFVFLGTWELPGKKIEKSEMGVFKNFRSVFSNKSFLIHIAMYICSYGALDILMGWIKFYMIDYLNGQHLILFGLGTILIFEIIGLPFYVSYANKKGHSKAYIAGLIIWGISMVLISFHEPFAPGTRPGLNAGFMLFITNCMLIGAGVSAGVVIPWTILPFTTDVDELITGKKRAGIYSGAMTLIRKLIQGAMVIPLLGLMLTVIGYKQPSRAHVALIQSAGKIQQAGTSISRVPDFNRISAADHKIETSIDRFDKTFQDLSDNVNRDKISESIRNIRSQRLKITGKMPAEEYRNIGLSISESARTILRELRIRQAPEAVGWLRILFIISPIVLIVFGIFFATRFKLNPQTHAILISEIERLNKGGSMADVDPDVRKICEDLTGIPYNDLYRS